MPGAAALVRRLAVGLSLVLAAPASSTAQRLLTIGADGTRLFDLARGESTAVAPEATASAVFTSDGQYLIRTDRFQTATRLRHVASGVELPLPWPFVPEVAHPRELVLFGTLDGVLTRLDRSGITRWSLCDAVLNVPFQLSDDGTRIFTVCPTGHFLVVDSSSGAVVRDTVVGEPWSIRSFVASPDGAEIVVFRQLGTGPEVARLDAISGATLRRRPPSHPLGLHGLLYAVPGGSRFIEWLYVVGTPGRTSGADARLVDFSSLETFPELLAARTPIGPRVVVSVDGREGYFGSMDNVGDMFSWQVRRVDLTSNLLLGTANGLAVIAVATPPHPVETVTAVVSGRRVELSWRLPALSPAATGYRLAIGSAPGAANLGSITVGPAESFAAAGVPSGRYYVRVHTVNVTGESGPSAEIVVDVP